MPEAERSKLHAYVAGAHAKGYKVRFWATPDQPGEARDAVWTELHRAGVDQINTDDLSGPQQFLEAQQGCHCRGQSFRTGDSPGGTRGSTPPRN